MSSSVSVVALITVVSNPRRRAADCAACTTLFVNTGLLGFASTATWVAFGTTSCSNSSFFATSSPPKARTPVVLPPDRDLAADEIGGHRGHPIELAVGPAIVDRDVATV